MKTKQQYLLISSTDTHNIGIITIGPPNKKNIIKVIVELEEKLKATLQQHFDNDKIEIPGVLDVEEVNAMFEHGKRIEVELAIGWADGQESIKDKVYIEKTWLLA
jgi:hypothetical protein